MSLPERLDRRQRVRGARGRRAAVCLALSIGLAAVVVAGLVAAVAPRWEPVAVAGLGSDRIAVLNKTGEVELVTGGTRKPLSQLRGFTALDLAGVGNGGAPYVVLVSSVRRNLAGDVIGALDAIPSGQALRTPGTIYSGVALKAGSPTVGFAANSRGHEIYSLAFSGNPITTKHLADVPDPNAILGSLAVDASGQRLYVADLAGGSIWSVPASGGESTLFATGLRDVRALAADDRWVFAADGDGRRIVQFAQRPPPNAPRQTAASARNVSPPELKSPSAVAIVGAGQIAVGDSSAGAVFLITTSDGKVVRTIR